MDNFENDTLTPPAPMPLKEEGESITMPFIDAMKEILAGQKVRRISWPNPKDHCLLKNGWISIFTKDNFYTWNINDGDYEGQDWIVVREN